MKKWQRVLQKCIHLKDWVKEATPLQLQALAPADYWIKAPMVANPVRGPRWAGRLNDDLRATP